MNWIIFVILYLIVATIFNQSYKIATKNLKNPGALTVLLEFIGAITILIWCPFFEMKFPSDIKVYILLGLSIVFFAITDRLNTTVRKGLEASTFSMIRQLSTVFMIFAGVLFFKDPFVINKFIGAILIVLSNFIIFYQKVEYKNKKYIILGIVSNLFFTLAMFFNVNISDNFNLPFYVAITLGLPAILIFIFERIKFSDIKTEFKNGNKKAMLITSVTWALGSMLQLRAYQLGNVSIVAPLCALTVILNVIAGYFLLKEKNHMLKKVIAAILIILGIILIKI
jgi:drug/metabolite transporter (DMT)-like permease